jgi:Fe-S-cluster containining protein
MQEDKRWELFKCLQCGKCCTETGLPYDSNKIVDIARFLNLTTDKVIENFYGRFSKDRKSWNSEDSKRIPCSFIITEGNKKTCKIYQVRPNACRQFPFETYFGRQAADCPAAKIVMMKLAEK